MTTLLPAGCAPQCPVDSHETLRPAWTGMQLAQDPTRVVSRAEFTAALAALRGNTSLNVLVARSDSNYRARLGRGEPHPPLPLTRTLVTAWLSGRSLPKTPVALVTLLAACGAEPQTWSAWLNAWERARAAT